MIKLKINLNINGRFYEKGEEFSLPTANYLFGEFFVKQNPDIFENIEIEEMLKIINDIFDVEKFKKLMIKSIMNIYYEREAENLFGNIKIINEN